MKTKNIQATKTFRAELTDTFAGEANYGWVKRAEFQAPENASDRLLLMRGRKALNLSGATGRITNSTGDFLEWRPYRRCAVLFITC